MGGGKRRESEKDGVGVGRWRVHYVAVIIRQFLIYGYRFVDFTGYRNLIPYSSRLASVGSPGVLCDPNSAFSFEVLASAG